jgi:hypothetical protein
MGDEMIYLLYQDGFAIHFFDNSCRHFALPEALNVCLTRKILQFVVYFWQIVAFAQRNLYQPLGFALFV